MIKFLNIAKKHLFNLNRSLTGKGVYETLKIIKKQFPKFKILSINSGTKVFDWKVPPEWNVKNAYILDKYNNKILDFKKNNLHLMGYSIPVNKKLKKNELKKKIFFLKKLPKAIPYITSYYKKRWGFCTSYEYFKKFDKKYANSDNFKIVIESKLNSKGKLNYGEIVLKGKSNQEILISTYICHPSMANDNLSGIIVSMALIDYFKNKKLEKTLRFIFIPETIGSISYLSKNIHKLKKKCYWGL